MLVGQDTREIKAGSLRRIRPVPWGALAVIGSSGFHLLRVVSCPRMNNGITTIAAITL